MVIPTDIIKSHLIERNTPSLSPFLPGSSLLIKFSFMFFRNYQSLSSRHHHHQSLTTSGTLSDWVAVDEWKQLVVHWCWSGLGIHFYNYNFVAIDIHPVLPRPVLVPRKVLESFFVYWFQLPTLVPLFLFLCPNIFHCIHHFEPQSMRVMFPVSYSITRRCHWK